MKRWRLSREEKMAKELEKRKKKWRGMAKVTESIMIQDILATSVN